MIVKRIALLSALASILSGCHFLAPHLRAPASAAPPSAAFAAADGKAFYLFRSGYQCGGPMPASPLLASWVDRIEIVEGRFVRWGSRCGGEGLPLPENELRSARLSSDGTTLMIGKEVYRQSADPIKEAEMQP